ncbi:MAG: lytic transglycosylase domain-containing protein [Solirubrobacteraceae bacterium]
MASVLIVFALLALGVKVVAPLVGGTLQRLSLPLADAGVIRAQAQEKHLDPALIAAVIYAETKFDPRTSPAGALGLMQIEPETAAFIAHRSGGIDFTTSDLASPAVNLAYGCWYLRYLLDHYEQQELPTVAAYNAGLTAVDRWVAAAAREGRSLAVQSIPYPETRAYVERVLSAQGAYRATYPQQLGLG